MAEDGGDSNTDEPASSVFEGSATDRINLAVEQMEPVIEKISRLMQQYRGRRVSSTDSSSMCWLRYFEVELSSLSELLKHLPLSDLGPNYIDSSMNSWLYGINALAERTGKRLDKREQSGAIFRFFCRTRLPFQLNGYWLEAPYIIDSPSRYRHLLLGDDANHTSRTSSTQPHPYLQTDESSMPLVGIESTLANKVIRWFMDDQEDMTLKIISMVGPVGVGKTAIAMDVYRKLRRRGREEGDNLLYCATAKLSRRPDMKKLLLHILSQIDETEAPMLASVDELLQKISQCLQDRRYLIVIDDIWEISDWNIMKNAFPKNSRGSRMVITTQIRSIARECCSYTWLVHEVKSLGELDSKNLLFRKAFGSEVDNPPENIRQVCSNILRRCEGIPLFINGMADWLHQKQQEVQHISNYSMDEVPQLLKIFEQALSPTYDDLSYQMKVLVLYMSMFPDGYIFEMDTLHCRWNFEHFTECGNAEGMKEFSSELIDRNVITPVANWKGTSQLEEDCHYKVNYFMLQFLVSKSVKGFVCTSGSLTSVARSNCNNILRRISLHQPDPDLQNFLNTRDLSHTRSLAISGTVDRVPLEKFVHLSVLDLEGWQRLKNKDLSLICNSGMFLLKYFSLRNTSISRLPPEIKKLLMLHTLVASHTQISELPSELCELGELESLDLRSTQIRQLPEHIWKIPRLGTLLVGGDRVNCDLTITEVTEGMRFECYLRTLETVDLSECSACFVEALACLFNLEKLSIRWSFGNCTDARLQKALCSCIKESRFFKSLTIHCGLGCQMDFLTSLPNPLPHGSIEKFEVTGGSFVKIPQWFQGLQSLHSIEITVCRLEEGDVGILASLPSLVYLILGLRFVPEKVIVIDRVGFPRLQKLSVCCRVPWLTFSSEAAMPSLTCLELKIGGGPRSEERIPSGFENLQNLWELVLSYNEWYTMDSNVQTIVDAVTKGVAKHRYPNLITVIINGNPYKEGYVQEAREDAAKATRCQSATVRHDPGNLQLFP